MSRTVRTVALLAALALLGACSAPQTTPAAAAPAVAPAAAETAAAPRTPAGPGGTGTADPVAGPRAGAAPVLVPERGCRVDADCAVVTAQTCCGAVPACAAKGSAPVEACRCDAGQCTPASAGAPVDR